MRAARYAWEDVVLGAQLHGRWEPLVARARRGLACLAREEEAGDEDSLPEDDVDTAANEFRYERDLVTAQEMEAWLERWELTVESWMSYIRADLLRKSLEDEPEEVEVSSEESEEFLRVEAICSRDLERFAISLAGRAAVHDRMVEEGSASGQLPADREAALADLDLAYQRFAASAMTPAAVAERIRTRHLEWTRLHGRRLTFPREEMAREALQTSREEGGLETAATDSGVELEDMNAYLEDLDGAARDRLLAARPGDLVGPLLTEEGFVLLQVLEKTMPSAADPAIVEKAKGNLLDALVAREVDNRVAWMWKL